MAETRRVENSRYDQQAEYARLESLAAQAKKAAKEEFDPANKVDVKLRQLAATERINSALQASNRIYIEQSRLIDQNLQSQRAFSRELQQSQISERPKAREFRTANETAKQELRLENVRGDFQRDTVNQALGIANKLERGNLPEQQQLILRRQLAELTGRSDQSSLQLQQQRDRLDQAAFDRKAEMVQLELRGAQGNLVIEQRRQLIAAALAESQARERSFKARQEQAEADQSVRDARARLQNSRPEDKAKEERKLESSLADQAKARENVAAADRNLRESLGLTEQIKEQHEAQNQAMNRRLDIAREEIRIGQQRLEQEQKIRSLAAGGPAAGGPAPGAGGGGFSFDRGAPAAAGDPFRSSFAPGGGQPSIPRYLDDRPVAQGGNGLQDLREFVNSLRNQPAAANGFDVAADKIVRAISEQPRVGSITINSDTPFEDASSFFDTGQTLRRVGY